MNTENRHILHLTGAQAAVFIGISYRQLQQMLYEDSPPPREDDKTYRSDKLGEWVRARSVRMALGGKKRGPKTLGEYTGDETTPVEMLNPVQERARKDKELADKTALENQVRRGELVEADEVAGRWKEILLRVRSRLGRVPWSVAPLLVGVDNLVKIQATIEDAVRDALSELASGEKNGP